MVCPQFDSLPTYPLTDHEGCLASRLVIVAALAPLCDSLPRPIATHLVQTLIVVQVEHECPSLAVGVAVVSLIVRHRHASPLVSSSQPRRSLRCGSRYGQPCPRTPRSRS